VAYKECKEWAIVIQSKRKDSLSKDVVDLIVNFWTSET
jgi:hypothetical protein